MHVLGNEAYKAKNSRGYFPIIRVDFNLMGAEPIRLSQSDGSEFAIESQSELIFDTSGFNGTMHKASK